MRDFPDGLLPGPFTMAQARAAGVSEGMLRGKRVRPVFPGVYVGAAVPDTVLTRCGALRLLRPEAVVSHETAVQLWRLPMPWGADLAAIHVTDRRTMDGRASRTRVAGVNGHLATLADDDIERRSGLLVTSIARTWCDLAASGWSRLDLVAYADAVLRRSTTDGYRRLAAGVERWKSSRGTGALREALGLAAFRVDSPMETRLRLLLLDAGLPAPIVNQWVVDDLGDRVLRPDLSWPRWRYAIDYDGIHHLRRDSDTEVLAHTRDNWRRRVDHARVEQLDDIGWQLTVVTAYELVWQPDHLVAKVRRILRRRGAVV